jgi:hypothetical protein
MTAPKKSNSNLGPHPGYFQVKEGDVYDHYAIVLGDRVGNFVKIDRLPLVRREGYVTVDSKVYLVTLKDLIRRKINVGNEPITCNRTGGNTTTPRSYSDNPVVVQGSKHSNKQGAGGVSEFQIDENVNLAWKNQIDSLCHLEDPEAEWEFMEDSTQSERVNESSTTSPTNQVT